MQIVIRSAISSRELLCGPILLFETYPNMWRRHSDWRKWSLTFAYIHNSFTYTQRWSHRSEDTLPLSKRILLIATLLPVSLVPRMRWDFSTETCTIQPDHKAVSSQIWTNTMIVTDGLYYSHRCCLLFLLSIFAKRGNSQLLRRGCPWDKRKQK